MYQILLFSDKKYSTTEPGTRTRFESQNQSTKRVKTSKQLRQKYSKPKYSSAKTESAVVWLAPKEKYSSPIVYKALV